MSSEEIGQLEHERTKGSRAKAANNEFFIPFFEEKEKVMIEAFRSVSVTDTESLINIKMQFKALDTLKDEMNTFITTGKMASKILTEIKEKENHNGDKD